MSTDRGGALPELSVVVVVGELRARAERTLAGLRSQTALDRIEVVVVDTAGAAIRALSVPDGLTIRRIEANGASASEALAAGVDAARGPVVAFIEDHAVPEANWARALIDAYREPRWGAVGYAFRLPEPSNYVSRAALVSEAGQWMAPARRRSVRSLPTTNVSIKRELLNPISEEGSALLYSHVLCGQLEDDQHSLLLEPEAVVSHEYFLRLWPLVVVNFGHGRLLGEARSSNWGRGRRLLWALGTPLSAPLVRTARLARGLSGAHAAARALVSAPVLAMTYAAAGVGEALGYLFGAGPWRERVEDYELAKPRLDARLGPADPAAGEA